jgi:benzoylformate decarboxylase
VQLAQPDRPVVCVIGEGSVQYAVTAFWSAVAYRTPVTFLVLRNSEYAILKWFSAIEGVEGAPGLDLPQLDTASIAAAYGVGNTRVDTADELREALTGAIASNRPELVEVGVAPGMWLF